MEDTNIGHRIKVARERKFYGRTELAKMAGISYLALYRIEEGQRKPRLATIRKLAQALEMEPADLVGQQETPSSEALDGA